MHIFIDVQKSQLNTGKLVKRAVQVHGHDGKTFMRMQWVDPNTDNPVFHEEHKPNKPLNLKPHPAPLGLKHTEHGLSDEELNLRHGLQGSMDISKLTEGEPLYKRKDVKASKSLIAQYKFTKGYENEIDVEEHVSNIFKNLTTEGIEHAFSTPDGKFMAHVDQLSVRGNPIHGHIECGLDVSWTDKKGNSVGSTSRSVFRDKNGHLHVYNDSMELNSKYQSKGLAQHEQERTEQLWRYLSDGHPVHLSLDANISVGVYAWAMKGYDFEDEDELANAKQEFSTFCNKNGLDIKETLHNCGYESIDSLQHSWQFASLDDGNPYKLADIEANPHEGVKKHLSGHLGKMFMLGGKQYWGAEKILNGGTEHESIAQEHKKSTKKGGK